MSSRRRGGGSRGRWGSNAFWLFEYVPGMHVHAQLRCGLCSTGVTRSAVFTWGAWRCTQCSKEVVIFMGLQCGFKCARGAHAVHNAPRSTSTTTSASKCKVHTSRAESLWVGGNLPIKCTPIFCVGCTHCLPISVLQCFTNVSKRHEQCIHKVPCALSLHCSPIDYIFHYNALHCFASQHETKVSCHCRPTANTVVTAELFGKNLLMLVCIIVYRCHITTRRHTTHPTHQTQCPPNASTSYPPQKNNVPQAFWIHLIWKTAGLLSSS